MTIIDPDMTGLRRKLKEAPPIITIIGLPPAGGCVIPKSIIKLTPIPTANGIEIKIGNDKCINSTPTNDVIKWPKKIFLGWANGLSGYPYKRTIEDPKEAIIKTPSSVLYVRNVKIPIVIAEKKPAVKTFIKFCFCILRF